MPTQAPSTSGAQCCYHGGCASFGTAHCNAAGAWCSESEERCKSCAGTLCLPPSLQRICVPSNEGVYNDSGVWGPACRAAGTGAVCPEPMCKWAAGGLMEVDANTAAAGKVRSHRFLGTVLLQARGELGRAGDAAGAVAEEL